MKLQELKQIIREEIINTISEQNQEAPDVTKLSKALGSSSSIKTALFNINDRKELRDHLKTITQKWGPSLQPDKISLATILSDVKIGLTTAGYK